MLEPTQRSTPLEDAAHGRPAEASQQHGADIDSRNDAAASASELSVDDLESVVGGMARPMMPEQPST
jgi:hypothetical protein